MRPPAFLARPPGPPFAFQERLYNLRVSLLQFQPRSDPAPGALAATQWERTGLWTRGGRRGPLGGGARGEEAPAWSLQDPSRRRGKRGGTGVNGGEGDWLELQNLSAPLPPPCH